MFRPDTREFVELYGIDQFASQASCEHARDAQFKRNMAVVEFFRTQRRDWWQADRFGPCHCDMTVERASPNFLSDAARDAADSRRRGDPAARPRTSARRARACRIRSGSQSCAPDQRHAADRRTEARFDAAPVAATNASNSPEDLRITKAVDTTRHRRVIARSSARRHPAAGHHAAVRSRATPPAAGVSRPRFRNRRQPTPQQAPAPAPKPARRPLLPPANR